MLNLRPGLVCRIPALVACLLVVHGVCNAQPEAPWPATRLWSVHLLADPPIFEPGDDIGRLQALPRWTGDAYRADVRVVAPDGSTAFRTSVESLAESLGWQAPAGGNGLYSVEATITDPDGVHRVFTSPLVVGSISTAKDAIGARAARTMLDPEDALASSTVRFAQAWCGAPLGRITRREAELLLQVRTSLDLVDADELEMASRRAIPARIQNARAPTLASRHTRFWWILPDAYESRDDWPLVVFLHGSEGRPPEMTRALYNPVRSAIERGDDIPAVVLIPKCDAVRHWSPPVLDGLVDWAVEHLRVDPDRVAATGLSLGGKGSWEWAMASPGRLSAIAPFAGNANPLGTQHLRHLPVWNTHGRRDRLVDFYLSANLVEMLERLGGTVRFDVIPEGGHRVWDEHYADEAFWAWLLSHERRDPIVEPAISFDLAGLSESELINLDETAFVGIPVTHDWETEEPQENSRTASPIYQRVYDVPGLVVRGPHTLETSAVGTFLGVLVEPEDGSGAVVDVDQCEHRTVSGRVVRAYYSGSREGCAAAFDVLNGRVESAGHTPTGRRLTRIWWDDWHGGTCFRELWLFVE